MFVYGPFWAVVIAIVTVLVLLYVIAAIATWVA